MSVSLVTVRKAAEFSWDTSKVVGETASIEVTEGQVEVRDVKNTGKANVFFPNDFHGACSITVKGSDSGQDSGTISV